MNKLDGGVMDIQEKKAFEIAFENKLGAHCCQFDLDEDGNYEDRETLCGWHMWLEAKAQAVPDLGELQERIAGHQYYHDEHSHMVVDMDDVVKEISGFDSWKAQAVPEVINVGDELQSWVAVNSFAASDAVGDFPVIDANALAEVIEKLTGANQ